MKLLAVDDEPIFCDVLKAHLEQLGYEDVTFANSGAEALLRIADTGLTFDCFLVDIRMIPMDGIELVKAIRAMPAHQSTPIIVISALSDKASIEAAFLAGANDYITKPIETVDLKVRLAMAQSILEERAQARLLQERIFAFEASTSSGSRFETEFPLEEVESAMPVGSLENFLLKQGSRRLRQACAIGFHIPKAEIYHQMMEPIYYADLLGEIAVVISKVMSSVPHMISHLGSGDIVAVLLDHAELDVARLCSEIEAELEALRQRYAAIGMTAPAMNVGSAVRLRRFPLECPTALISKARESARGESYTAKSSSFLDVA